MSRVAVIVGGIFCILLVLSYTIVDQEFYNVSPLDPGLDLSPGLVPGMYLWGALDAAGQSFTGYELALAPHAPVNYSRDDTDSPEKPHEELRGILKRVKIDSINEYGGEDSNDAAEACDEASIPDLTDSIALVHHGQCSLFTKMINCQSKGAKAIVFSGSGLPIVIMEAVRVPALIVSPTDFEVLSNLEGESASMWTLPPDLDFSLARLALLLFVRPLIMLSILLVIFVANIRSQSKHRRPPPEVVSRLPTYHWMRTSPPNAWNQQQCTICLEDFEDNCELMVLPCRHEFHRLCVAQWLLLRRGACPLCWREIPNERTELLP